MKIFIAQKMTGLTTHAIERKRTMIIDACKTCYGNDVTILDQFHIPDVPDGITSDAGIGIYMLGGSLQILAEADLVVLDDDISTSKGSLVEEFVTKTYNIPTITYKELRDKKREYVKKSMTINPSDDIAVWSTMLSPSQLFPKKIARISVCGALNVDINENMDFVKPTPEQIKNLHDTFCIDVELFDDIQEKSKMISKESLHHIMSEWIKPKLEEYELSGGYWRHCSNASSFYWGLSVYNRTRFIGVHLCYGVNNTIIGYDIWTHDEASINIKIREDSIEFIEDSEFEDFSKEEMKDLYDKIKSVLQEE